MIKSIPVKIFGSKVLDKTEFKESEHPRSENGQFTAGAGGKSISGGVTIPKKGTTSNQIWAIAHEIGKGGKPATAKQIAEHAKSKGLEFNSATVSTQLNNYKKWAASQSTESPAKEEKKEPEKLINNKKTVQNLVSGKGYEKEFYESKGIVYFSNEGNKISYKESAGTWQAKEGGILKAEGNSVEELQNYLQGKPEASPKPQKETIKPAATASIPQVDPHSTASAPSYGSSVPSSNFKYTKHGIPSPSGFSEGIQKSIKRYSGSSYGKINNALRYEADFDNVDPAILRDCLNIQKAFQQIPPTTQDCTVGRKIQLNALKTMAKHAGLNHLSEIKPGMVFQEEGVCSTSHSEGVWNGDVRLSINIPKGSKAINIESISLHSSEKETILPPGTKFKINNVSQDTGNFKFHLEVEVVT